MTVERVCERIRESLEGIVDELSSSGQVEISVVRESEEEELIREVMEEPMTEFRLLVKVPIQVDFIQLTLELPEST